MKKILFYGETITHSLHGVSISNQLFLDDLSDRFDIDVIQECSDLSEHGKVGFLKITNYISSLYSVFRVARTKKVHFFYSTLSVSTQGALKSLIMLLCIKAASPKTKIIIHVHRGDLSIRSEQSVPLSFLFKCVFKLSYRVLLISKKLVSDYNKHQFLNCDHYMYVANSIDTIESDKVDGDSYSNRNAYLYLSNYIEEKGILDLLSVWSDLPCGFSLKCFGGETPNITISLLKRKYPIKSIVFSKSIKDIEKFTTIASSKALILPSWNEGVPLVILEAMSLGVPVIASNVGFIQEMVGNDYPFLFEPKNKEAIKDMIVKFNALPPLAQENFGSMLKERFVEHYSRENRVNDYLKAFC